ncbi:MAG: class I SAM-dependent methyltransferase [Candidatus Izimaplasma sp.]|nr:class I SAM-dependent methyltransferase [Candidatus Izimaplasma bacterium]
MIYNKLAMYYDQFVDHNLNDIYHKLIKKSFNNGTVLDLGCGTGPLAIKLAKDGFYVTASDISEGMLERAFNNSLNADVKINFFVHNIIDPLNIDSDIITMSSDVINYLDEKAKVLMAFKNVREIMNHKSIFVFDFLKTEYLTNLAGYHEEINLDNSKLVWSVENTDKELQIKHKVTIDNISESHIQTTFTEKEYLELLEESNLKMVDREELDERVIFVCKTF